MCVTSPNRRPESKILFLTSRKRVRSINICYASRADLFETWQQLVPVAVASACLNFPFLRIITSFIVICFTAFNNWEVEVVNDANSDDSQFKCEICACWFWHLHRLTLKQYGLSVLPALQIWRIIRWKIYQISVSRQNLKMYRKLFYHSHHFFY